MMVETGHLHKAYVLPERRSLDTLSRLIAEHTKAKPRAVLCPVPMRVQP